MIYGQYVWRTCTAGPVGEVMLRVGNLGMDLDSEHDHQDRDHNITGARATGLQGASRQFRPAIFPGYITTPDESEFELSPL
jgi:hypothetical protein